MSVWDRLLGIDSVGNRAPDRITYEVFAALLGEYARGNLLRMKTPQSSNSSSAAAQTATTAFNPGVTFEVGGHAVLMAHCTDDKIISSVSDTVNTWTVDSWGNGGAGTEWWSVASAPITTQITAASTVTITWSAATSSSVRYFMWEVFGLAASSFFDQASALTQVSEQASITTTDAIDTNTAAVFAGFKHDTNAGFSLEQAPRTEEAFVSTASVNAAAVRMGVQQTDPVTVGGLWDAASTGLAFIAAYRGEVGNALFPLVSLGLSSPLQGSVYGLAFSETSALHTFCDAIDAAADPEFYVEQIRQILLLTHRLTPGYTDQNTVIARLGL